MTTEIVEISTAEEIYKLATAAPFHSNVGELKWRDAHAILYHTANKLVVIKLVDGTAVTGTLDEVPSYFGGFHRKVWLRQEGRKTRKGVPVAQILSWSGQKAPDLAEALTAYLVLERPGTITDEHENPVEALAWAQDIARKM